MALGYMGKLIRAKLSEGKIEIEDLNMDDARGYIGGVGLGTKMIYEEVPPSSPGVTRRWLLLRWIQAPRQKLLSTLSLLYQ